MLDLAIDLPTIDTGPFAFGEDPLRAAGGGVAAPEKWQERLPLLFKNYLWHGFSQPHIDLWEWVADIDIESKPRPFVALWPRGRGKSTHLEMLIADLGMRGKRQYCLYVCETQDQADKHIATIASMLEGTAVERYYPAASMPKLGKNGGKRWNRRMLTTANGFTVEAVGLDKAVRGQKIDWARPDLIAFDDIDAKHDTENAIAKKESTITASIIPSGSDTCAFIFAQNVIHEDSIAHRLSHNPGQPGAADYLADRIISGPHKAVDGLEYDFTHDDSGVLRWVITNGRSLWDGFTIEICENELNDEGPTAFLLERQHEVDTDNPDALLSEGDFARTRLDSHPDLVRVGVGVDPPGGVTECGIVAAGKAKIGSDWHGFTLEDATMPKGTRSEDWALAVLQCYYRVKADVIFVERNYGGDMASGVIRQAKWLDADGRIIVDGSSVRIIEVTATRGKQVRAEPVATVYQQGRGHNVGHFPKLEKEWRTWIPGDKESPNRLDAHVWVMTGLELVGEHLQPLPKQETAVSKWQVGNRPARGGSRWKV